MEGEAYQYCKKILTEVSRSFALSIPMLDDVLQKPVTIVYLQDRLLDNFEDELPEDKFSLED
ncbi:MAG TPA: squalene/phytoene synthase family protein, partial [Halanaerobiales bacterium]|nr:squalene/phytoene synthase family protein [Halanaerobiales bacterium]